jgi:hypothetical protein
MFELLGTRHWPDGFDTTVIWLYCGLLVALPVLGYAMMVIDIRAYLRALRGMLVRVVYHFPSVPTWARHETPGCLRTLGLSLPCTREDVKRAYRSRAEKLHPDRGGDRRKFLTLQRDFEAALQFLTDHEPEFKPGPAAQDSRSAS